MGLISSISVAIGMAIFLLLLVFSIMSWLEKERRAASYSLLLAVLIPLPFFAAGMFDIPYQNGIALFLVSITVLAAFFVFTPVNPKYTPADDVPRSRIDERDVIFSRYYWEIGSNIFHEYYRRNPDKKELDDKFRAKPGLMKKGSIYYDPFTFSAAIASFESVKAFHGMLDEKRNEKEREGINAAGFTFFVKKWARKLGAASIGITELKDYHLYSVIGRGERYGEPVDLKHKYAIALTVEMDKNMLDTAPLGPATMETAQQYLVSGSIAVQIAEFINNLGYAARAHIDGNYRVICPLVARDAGLGEIGRMGLLMTPELGSRVRIAVVTTDIPLNVDRRIKDHSVTDFCSRCKKCADVCPSKAIPFEDRVEIDGVKRWKINSESCFTFWCTAGTDCGRCVSVCPYSHPDSMLHNFVRMGVRNSLVFRKLALTMDDFFYGRKPAPSPQPEWMKLES